MRSRITLLLLAATLKISAQPCIPNTNSIQFDGSSSYVSISPQNGLDITSVITIEAWINPASFGFNSAQNSIVCKHGWSSGEGGFVLRCGGSGELSFNIAGIDVNQMPVSWVEVFSGVGALTLNTWTHVAGTFDGNELKCYVNGNLAGLTTFQGTIAPSTSYPLALGRLADPVYGPDRYFSGSMDEVRIWNRALTQAELAAGMNNHIDPMMASGLVSYWRLNEGAGSTIYDVAGVNNGGLVLCNWNTSVPFNAVPDAPVIIYFGGELSSSATSGNQWYLNGTAIAGATSDNYTPVQNGTYTVEVTSPEGCSTLSAPVTVTDVAVAELNTFSNAKVFPNPVSKDAILEISARGYTGDARFLLTDLQGREILAVEDLVMTSMPTSIPLEGKIPAGGIYTYFLLSPNGLLSKGKLAVQ